MPVYVYETLPEKGRPAVTFEIEQRMSDAALTHHPETGEPIKRVLATTFIGGKYSGSAAPCGASEPALPGCGAGACGRCVD
ncbi:MAG: hypothetical protein OEZ06_27165 [Myxococcales bacterium]|nr:hypothetical protein [Myxococcales bacterium]